MNLPDIYKIYKHAWIFSGPVYSEKQITRKDAHLLLKNGGWLVRNVYDFDNVGDIPTDFWYVIKDNYGGMEELKAKTRNQVKRGLANYTIRRITTEELLSHGYDIYCAAAASYKVAFTAPSFSSFKNRIQNTNAIVELWGAYNAREEMVAFAVNEIIDNYCYYQIMKANPEDTKNYVYYALIFEMNRYYLQECHMQFVLDGARSITEHSNMQPFLESKFNFRKAYCHLKIYYTWWFGIIVKCLYPFRKIIKNNQIHAVLAMHGMQS